jgi:hypothetical protein
MDFTFTAIKTALVTKLKEYSEWKNEILTIGVYSILLDIVSFIIEKLAYYVDFLFIETTTNATLKSNVSRIAKDYGYIPTRKSGSLGYLIFGTDSTFSSTGLEYQGSGYLINKYIQFQNTAGDIILYATEDVSLIKGTVQKVIYPDPGTQTMILAGGDQTGIRITAHGLSFGDKIYISGTLTLNGVWILTNYTSTNYIALNKIWEDEEFSGLEPIYVGYALIPVRQGVPTSYTYVGTGILNEKIPIYSDSIDQQEIYVYLMNLDGSVNYEIPIVEDIYFSNQTDTYTCEIENFPDYSGLFIKFGDNITSKQLVSGDIIKIRYSITLGANGNLRSSSLVTAIASPLTNILGEVETIYVTNVDEIIGGTDLETIAQIKKQYSRAYSSSKQLTKRDAWESAIEEKQYVYRAKVWTELDLALNSQISLTASGKQNYHYITGVNTEGNGLTPSQQVDISNNILLPRKSPTDVVSWQTLIKIRIKFDILAEIVNTISFTDMKNRISTQLKADYGVLNLNFAQNIYTSNYIRTIDLIKDIIRHETTASYAEENIPISAQSDGDGSKNFLATKTANYYSLEERILLVENSTQLWIRRKIDDVWYPSVKIGQSQGVSVSGTNFFTVSGNISYNSGSSLLDQATINYSCNDLLVNVVPFINVSGTVQANTQIVTNISSQDIIKLSVGMYVNSASITVSKKIIAINNVSRTITLESPISILTNSSESIKVGWFPDHGSQFGIKNPDDSSTKGYILYLVYQTKDGYNKRIGDLRLGNFNQILDYSPDLSEFNFIYGNPNTY